LENGISTDVEEVNWWQKFEWEHKSNKFVVSGVPAQHWCKRGLNDNNHCLWCGFVLEGKASGKKIFYSGDTGYCHAFKEIGEEFSPIDLSFIPIGAYAPRNFMRPQHVDPKEAVQIHKDIGSKQSIGIHWGTFQLSWEPYLEPAQLLKQLLEEEKIDIEKFITVNIGEIKHF